MYKHFNGKFGSINDEMAFLLDGILSKQVDQLKVFPVLETYGKISMNPALNWNHLFFTSLPERFMPPYNK